MTKTPSPSLAPLRRQNLAEQVVARLRVAIIAGQLAPDAPLAEPRLAQELGVSRSPIREALIQLEREGLIRFDERGRTRVCSMTAHDFAEISTLRISLEGLGAGWAASRWTPDLTAELEENIARQEKAPTLRELSRLDVELHDTIMRAAGHQRVYAAWQVIRPQFEMWLAHIHRQQQADRFAPREVTVQAHRQLLKVIASGKPITAEKAMRAHVQSWAEWLPAQFLPVEN
jgi:DNA-binding GntR family transcriptional regulator